MSTNLVKEITLLKIGGGNIFRRVSFPATAPLFNLAVESRNETRKSDSASHYTTTTGNCGTHWPSHGRGRESLPPCSIIEKTPQG